MLKTAVFDCAINEKCWDGAFALLFRPHTGGFDRSRVPTPGICHPRQKKNATARGSARGERGGGDWAQLELTDALRVISDILWSSCFESQYGPKDTR